MMIIFRLRFDEKKREREEAENKDKFDKPHAGRGYTRRGRGHGRATRPRRR